MILAINHPPNKKIHAGVIAAGLNLCARFELWTGGFVAAMKDALIDIRPELLGHVKDAVKSQLECPLFSGFAPGALWPRVIKIGKGGSR